MPRTRRAAIVAGVVFHASVYWTLAVATYTCSMFVLYLLFVDPEQIHRTIDELLGHEARSPPSGRPTDESVRSASMPCYGAP